MSTSVVPITILKFLTTDKTGILKGLEPDLVLIIDNNDRILTIQIIAENEKIDNVKFGPILLSRISYRMIGRPMVCPK